MKEFIGAYSMNPFINAFAIRSFFLVQKTGFVHNNVIVQFLIQGPNSNMITRKVQQNHDLMVLVYVFMDHAVSYSGIKQITLDFYSS